MQTTRATADGGSPDESFYRYLPQHPQRLRRHMCRWRLALAVDLHCLGRGLPVLFCLLLAACPARDETIGVGVVGHNHTDTPVTEFLLSGGGGGSYLSPHEGGGSTVCCTVIPLVWRPGLEVEVTWTYDLKNYKRQKVGIPRYEEAARMRVHFLRNGEVRIFVTGLALGHPDYPLTGPEASLNEGENPVREDLRNQGEEP